MMIDDLIDVIVDLVVNCDGIDWYWWWPGWWIIIILLTDELLLMTDDDWRNCIDMIVVYIEELMVLEVCDGDWLIDDTIVMFDYC